MRGTLLNVATVLVGSAIGVALGTRLPARIRETLLAALGLLTLVVGILNATEVEADSLVAAVGAWRVLVVLGALVVGAVIGELIDIEGRLERGGEALKRRVGARVAGEGGRTFVEGFVVASLVFCVGPLTILGSLQDGLTGDIELLALKSGLDGVAALAFASALGIGVVFSAITVLVVQGGIALSARWLEGSLTDPMIVAMTAVGGVLILGIGLRLLDVKSVRVANLLPAVVLAPLLVAPFD